ncbi:MAG: hypothetical protein U0V02_19060 [Anaerolineales bacterium]
MYNFYNTNPEKKSTWRNAYEIKMVALEHEKRRFQMMDGETSLSKPSVNTKSGRQAGWKAVLKVPLQLLLILIG